MSVNKQRNSSEKLKAKKSKRILSLRMLNFHCLLILIAPAVMMLIATAYYMADCAILSYVIA